MSKNNTQSTSFFSRHKFKIGGLLLGLVLGVFIPQAFAIDGVMWLVSSFVGGSGGALAGVKIDNNYNARKLDVVFPDAPAPTSVPTYQAYAQAGLLDSPGGQHTATQRFEETFTTAAKQISTQKKPANLSVSQDTYQHPEQPYTPSPRT